MRDIIKHLIVNRLEMQHSMAGKYLLRLVEPGTWPELAPEGTKSTLTMTAKDMIRFGLAPAGTVALGRRHQLGACI
jgi:hypothetical protein